MKFQKKIVFTIVLINYFILIFLCKQEQKWVGL